MDARYSHGGARHFTRYGVDSRGEQTQIFRSNSTIGRVNSVQIEDGWFTVTQSRRPGIRRGLVTQPIDRTFIVWRPMATNLPFASQISCPVQ